MILDRNAENCIPRKHLVKERTKPHMLFIDALPKWVGPHTSVCCVCVCGPPELHSKLFAEEEHAPRAPVQFCKAEGPLLSDRQKFSVCTLKPGEMLYIP